MGVEPVMWQENALWEDMPISNEFLDNIMSFVDRDAGEFEFCGTLVGESYPPKAQRARLMCGSFVEHLSIPSAPCGEVCGELDLALVDHYYPSKAQIVMHNGIEQKVRSDVSDRVLSFLSPADRQAALDRLNKRGRGRPRKHKQNSDDFVNSSLNDSDFYNRKMIILLEQVR
ncbi:hypothetical protein V6N13_028099 [Hibiscus sabdariffa]|uniref:Uncharacterized protein n=2 Tax=Hibiscus sabdariffa TaxID=183260 RepID=A0ABR2B1L9_9ROSI